MGIREDFPFESFLGSWKFLGSGFNKLNCLLQVDHSFPLTALTWDRNIRSHTEGLRVVKVLRLAFKLVHLIDNWGELAANDLVLEKDTGEVHIVIDTQIAFEKIIVEGIIQCHPVHEVSATAFQKPL